MRYYIDVEKTLGSQVAVVEASNWFEYVNGKRTDNILGVRLTVAVMIQQFERVKIKVRQNDLARFQKMIEDDKNHMPQVSLVNPDATMYVFAGKQGLSVVADDVKELS